MQNCPTTRVRVPSPKPASSCRPLADASSPARLVERHNAGCVLVAVKGHHGGVSAKPCRRRLQAGGGALTVLLVAYGPGGVSDASGSPTVVGTPTHPQILTCYEEATQFTGGTLPPVGPHDIGFGPGYFPQARRLATMNPPNSGRGAQLTGYKLPPVVYPGATVTMTIARGARSVRGATESLVTTPRERVGDVPGLLAQVRVLSPELPVHRWSNTGLRSPRRASRRAAKGEPHRSVVFRRTMPSFADVAVRAMTPSRGIQERGVDHAIMRTMSALIIGK